MTYPITASTRYQRVTLDAGDTIVDLNFPVILAADLIVARIRAGTRLVLTLDVDYGVSLLNQAPGARVTLLAPALQDDEIEAIGLKPIARATDLEDGNKFSDEALNAEFDNITIQLQEMRRESERSFRTAYGQAAPVMSEFLDPGDTLMVGPGGVELVPGPNAADIVNAGPNAAAAAASAAEADADRIATQALRDQTQALRDDAADLVGSIIPPAFPATLAALKALSSLIFNTAYLRDPLRAGQFLLSTNKGVHGQATVNSAGVSLPHASIDYRVPLTGGGGTGATARVVVRGGIVLGAMIMEPGSGYTGSPSLSTNLADWKQFHLNDIHPDVVPTIATENFLPGAVSTATDVITVANNTLKWITGMKVRFTTTGALPPSTPQLTAGVDYFIRRDSATGIKVYPTQTDATNDTNVVNLTNTGSGTHTITHTPTMPNVTFDLSDDILAVRANDGAEWLRVWDGTLDVRWAGAAGDQTSATETFAPAAVTIAADTITVANNASKWQTGMTVRFYPSGGALPAATPALVVGTDYFIRRIDATTLKVYPTLADANADTNAIDLTGQGTGTHTITQSPASDLPAIQAAVKALLRGKSQINANWYGGAPQAGGTLFFPPGTWFCNSGTLYINSIGAKDGTEFVGIRILGAVKGSVRPLRPDGVPSGSKIAYVKIVCGDVFTTGVFDTVSRGFALEHIEILGCMEWWGLQHSPLVSDVRLVPTAPAGLLRDATPPGNQNSVRESATTGVGFYAEYCSTASFENFFITSGDQVMFTETNDLDAATIRNCDQLYFQSCAFSFCRDGLKVLPGLVGAERSTTLVLDNCTFEANNREYLVLEGVRAARCTVTMLSRGGPNGRDSTKPMVRIGGTEQSIQVAFIGGSMNATPYMLDQAAKEVVSVTTVKFWGNYTHRYPPGQTCRVSNLTNPNPPVSPSDGTNAVVDTSSFDATNYETTVVMGANVFSVGHVDSAGNTLTRVLRYNDLTIDTVVDAGVGIDVVNADGVEIEKMSITNFGTAINRRSTALRVWHHGNVLSGNGTDVAKNVSSTDAQVSQNLIMGLDTIIQGLRSNNTLKSMLKLVSADEEIVLGDTTNVETVITSASAVQFRAPPRLQSQTVAQLGNAATAGAGAIKYCSNDVNGGTLVISDGANWRRMQDRNIATT